MIMISDYKFSGQSSIWDFVIKKSFFRREMIMINDYKISGQGLYWSKIL